MCLPLSAAFYSHIKELIDFKVIMGIYMGIGVKLMLLSPLTYTINKTPDQLHQFLESAMQQESSYNSLLSRYKVRIKQNRAGGFFLTTPVSYIVYKIKLTPDVSGDTTVSLKPEMRTFFKINSLVGYLIALAIAFIYLPFVIGQTIPLLDVLVVVMFPAAYFGNTFIGGKQTRLNMDAFMKEYIKLITVK